MTRRMLLMLALLARLCASPDSGLPRSEVDEIRALVRAHLPSPEVGDLSAPTVEGLLEQLGGRAGWVEPTIASPGTAPAAPPRRLDGGFGYVHLPEPDTTAVADLDTLLEELGGGPALRGLVLDLRFASGRDFAAASRLAGRFLPAGQGILDWGEGMATAGESNFVTAPIVLLVNAGTRGSAEALAAALRSAGRAVIAGGSSAGEAAQFTDLPLASGRTLRLTLASVRTGDGLPIPGARVLPDIPVPIPPDSERQFLGDPYRQVPGTPESPAPTESTLNAATTIRPRMTEAELIRSKRQSLGQSVPPRMPTATASPTLQDPVLIRGVDLLTALDALRPVGSP